MVVAVHGRRYKWRDILLEDCLFEYGLIYYLSRRVCWVDFVFFASLLQGSFLGYPSLR